MTVGTLVIRRARGRGTHDCLLIPLTMVRLGQLDMLTLLIRFELKSFTGTGIAMRIVASPSMNASISDSMDVISSLNLMRPMVI